MKTDRKAIVFQGTGRNTVTFSGSLISKPTYSANTDPKHHEKAECHWEGHATEESPDGQILRRFNWETVWHEDDGFKLYLLYSLIPRGDRGILKNKPKRGEAQLTYTKEVVDYFLLMIWSRYEKALAKIKKDAHRKRFDSNTCRLPMVVIPQTTLSNLHRLRSFAGKRKP